MKKLFLMFAALSCAMAISATTYSSHLKVTINGEATEQDQVSVEVTEADGAYTLTLKNFVLVVEEIPMPVGNIEVAGVKGVDEYGYTTITYNGPIVITAGDDPQYDFWMGTDLGEVPLEMVSRFTDTALTANIDINLAIMGQVIGVNLFGIAPAPQAVEGDVNHDGEVNISDVNAVIDIILTK